MPRPALAIAVLALVAAPALAVDPKDILPKDGKYDPAVPTPAKVFGFEVGERHLYHHQVVGYLKELAAKSDRVTVSEYARSHGNRPLVSAVITSPANHKRLDAIRAAHRRLADPKESAGVSLDRLPAVLWMGYGVHGNEPSATNVAPLVAYHLAAGTGADHDKLLDEIVVLLDPCLNPDGFDRFANWANDHKGATTNPDPNHREHREAWPGGRTNYYWFDLNRDWLPAVHPESKGRLDLYHQWKPNVVLDFHEMGSSSTYFFQPGHPTRVHPLIPKTNVELTRKLADHHAKALDKIGSLYFTEDRFDDFYPGKGSTYPDLHGAVGILFEQASSRGHAQDTPNGTLTFPFTIRNQFQTSLSSLRGTLALRTELLAFKRDFYAADKVADGPKGYVVSAPGNPTRLREFLTLLGRHDIRAYRATTDLKADGKAFPRGESWVIPVDQPEGLFLKVLFETRTRFADDVFYDISTWTLPLAFGLRSAPLDAAPALGEAYRPEYRLTKLDPADDVLAYAIDWRDDAAPPAVAALLAAGVKVRVAAEPFTAGDREFGSGTILVPLGIQPDKRAAVDKVLTGAGSGAVVTALRTGLTPAGPDLGDAAFVPVPRPKVLLVTGEGVSAYEAGEAWHRLDRRTGIPVTLVDAAQLGGTKLDGYTVVVLVSGTYAGVSQAGADALKEYVTKGGTIVATGTAVTWLNARKVVPVKLREAKEAPNGRRPYADAERAEAEKRISGAIFRTAVDHTHPLGYGLPAGDPLYVFRTGRVFLEPSDNPYSTPIVYAGGPQVSGYASAENVKLVAGSAGAVVVPVGTGRAVLLSDDPVFRGFWEGTGRVFLNAVFFGPVTRVP